MLATSSPCPSSQETTTTRSGSAVVAVVPQFGPTKVKAGWENRHPSSSNGDHSRRVVACHVALRARDQLRALCASSHARCGAASTPAMVQTGSDDDLPGGGTALLLGIICAYCLEGTRRYVLSLNGAKIGHGSLLVIFGLSPLLMSVTEMPAWCPVYLWTSRMLAYSKRRAIEPCGMGCGGWMAKFRTLTNNSGQLFASGNDDTSGVWEHRTSRGLIPGSEGMYGDNRSCSANNRKWWVHFHGASDRKAIIVNLVNQFPGDDTLGMKLPREDRWKKQGENYQGFLDDMHRAAAFVHLPSELENCDARDFFFSRIDADEAVILIDGPERHMRRIVVFDVLRTFTTKTFTALSTTSFTSQQRIFSSDGIVTKKSNGVRCFVLQVWEDQRKTLVIEEGTGSVTLLGTHCHNGALSHLSDSVFCITGKGVHETWDTNNTTAPLTVESVDPSNKPKQVRAEAGLLFRIVSQELVATLWPGITTTTIPQETPALLRIHFEGWLLGYITGSSSFLL